MIEMKDIFYAYDNKSVTLKNINLNIQTGESVAFIGANGSGKSTLIKMINGLIFPQRGSYFFCGEEITSKKMEKPKFYKNFHRRIGYIFQNSEVQIFCSNVFDEIAFGPRQLGLSEKEVEKRVNDVLKLFSIEDLKNKNAYHLSGGEKKKVVIASVMVLNPDIYIFDEPMNSLDPKTKKFLRELILNLNKSGKTIICSTHDFEYVEGVFKRAIVFSDDHNIISDGDYNKIISNKEDLHKYNII